MYRSVKKCLEQSHLDILVIKDSWCLEQMGRASPGSLAMDSLQDTCPCRGTRWDIAVPGAEFMAAVSADSSTEQDSWTVSYLMQDIKRQELPAWSKEASDSQV